MLVVVECLHCICRSVWRSDCLRVESGWLYGRCGRVWGCVVRVLAACESFLQGCWIMDQIVDQGAYTEGSRVFAVGVAWRIGFVVAWDDVCCEVFNYSEKCKGVPCIVNRCSGWWWWRWYRLWIVVHCIEVLGLQLLSMGYGMDCGVRGWRDVQMVSVITLCCEL